MDSITQFNIFDLPNRPRKVRNIKNIYFSK